MPRLPITPENIYRVVTEQGFGTEELGWLKSTTYRGIAERLGYPPEDERVHQMVRSMAVSGYIRQSPLGGFHRGPVPLPERASDIMADRRSAERLQSSAARGGLVTHGPHDACTLGLWHEGPCPDPRLEQQLHVDDQDQASGRVRAAARQTCGFHRCWMTQCVGDPLHAARDNAVLDAAGNTRAIDESPETQELRDRAELIRRARQPRPEDNPYTGRVTLEDLGLPMPEMSMTTHAESMRHTAHMYDDKARAGEPDAADNALFWHAAADAVEVALGVRPDPATGRHKPAGVVPGGLVADDEPPIVDRHGSALQPGDRVWVGNDPATRRIGRVAARDHDLPTLMHPDSVPLRTRDGVITYENRAAITAFPDEDDPGWYRELRDEVTGRNKPAGVPPGYTSQNGSGQ